MSPTVDPRTGSVAMLLRLEVGRLRQRESRRVFDSSLHVGRLAGERVSCVVRTMDNPVLDDALRTDLMLGLVEVAPDPATAWLVRSGPPDLQDSDLRWLAATHRAFGIHDRVPDDFFVLTRSGWLDPVSGEQRVWARLRL